jgi:mRNA interferase YafQ
MKVSQTSQFKKDVKRQKKRGKDLEKIKTVIELLLIGKELPSKYRDHSLVGNWSGHRDCHIEPDWLLIYRLMENELRLERTGSHADLFS